MPICFDLEELRKQEGCKVYLETGMYNPDDHTISLHQALKGDFAKVYSIELRQDFVNKALAMLTKEVESQRLHIIHDDSNFLRNYIANNSDFTSDKCLFYLDAHIDGCFVQSGNKHSINRCPVFEELKAIKELPRNDHVICIDDVRILRSNYPWYEGSYGDIDFFQEVKQQLLQINPNYSFKLLTGYEPYDVLCAYVNPDPDHIKNMVLQTRNNLAVCSTAQEHRDCAYKAVRYLRMHEAIEECLEFLEIELNYDKDLDVLHNIMHAVTDKKLRVKILSLGLNVPYNPKNDWCAWRLYDDLSIESYYQDQKTTCYRAYQILVDNNKFPDAHKDRITYNANFCKPPTTTQS